MKKYLLILYIIIIAICSALFVYAGPYSGAGGGTGGNTISGGSCTNQFMSGISVLGVPTCTTVPYANVSGTPALGTLSTLTAGTMTDTNLCTYTAIGTLIKCSTPTSTFQVAGTYVTPTYTGNLNITGGGAFSEAVSVPTQSAGTNNTAAASTAYVDKATSMTVDSGSIAIASGINRAYVICTSTCSVTPLNPVAGMELCVLNDDNVSTVITLVGITGVQYEATTRTSYGTAGNTMVSGGVAGDKICVVGRDTSHFMTISYTGTWSTN